MSVRLIRNAMYGITALPLKLHNYAAGLEIYHNTCVAARQGFQSFYLWQNGVLRNNLFMGGERYAMETGSPTPYTTLDYNGYRRNAPDRFLKWYDGAAWGRYQSIEEFFRATGHERHGVLVDDDTFVNGGPPGQGKTYEPDAADLRLQPNGAAVDRGQVLPTVNDGFAGAAPDLGASAAASIQRT